MWTPITFAPPVQLQTSAAELEQALADIPAGLSGTDARLVSVSRAYDAPAVEVTVNAGALRQAQDALLQAGGSSTVIHPYLHPLGDRRGDYSFMTPQQAVHGLADKLADPADPIGDDAAEAVLVLLRGVDHAGFAETLGAFNAVFPVIELQMVERRARALATLGTDKLIRTRGPAHPAWRNMAPRRHQTGAGLDMAMGRRLAIAESYAADTAPEAELSALIAKKQAHLLAAKAAWEDLTATLQGGEGQGLALAGNAAAIRRQLLQQLPPVDGFKLAACACWMGRAEQTTFFRECFGL